MFIVFIILVLMGWLWEALAGKLVIPGIRVRWMAAVSAAQINYLARADRIIERVDQERTCSNAIDPVSSVRSNTIHSILVVYVEFLDPKKGSVTR